MGGGSGLLCLRNTVALRIRVPPTFHPGPQLPTTAHGARPAPAHHGPAPHAICLLGQTTPLLPPRSQRCVLASPAPPPSHLQSENKKTGLTVTQILHVAFLELSGDRRNLERWLKKVMESHVHQIPFIAHSTTLSGHFKLNNYRLYKYLITLFHRLLYEGYDHRFVVWLFAQEEPVTLPSHTPVNTWDWVNTV